MSTRASPSRLERRLLRQPEGVAVERHRGVEVVGLDDEAQLQDGWYIGHGILRFQVSVVNRPVLETVPIGPELKDRTKGQPAVPRTSGSTAAAPASRSSRAATVRVHRVSTTVVHEQHRAGAGGRPLGESGGHPDAS